MINKWILILVCVFSIQLASAQENDLQVQGASPNLYLIHTVQPKENWYSVGRNFNISPKQLAPYNNLSIEKALAIGQTLKVPLTADNFSQDGSKTADEVFVPVHHTIQEKEWMYRVSVNYNKVPVENLEKWNGINKDQAKAGLKLIVGYLKVKTGQSAFAAKGQTKITSVSPLPATVPEEKKAVVVVKEEKKPVPPTVVNTDAPIAKNTPAIQETKPAVKQEIKPEPKPVVSNPANNNSNTTSSSTNNYFKGQYEESGKSMSGNAGIFKSTSGWNDGKYYALVNNVAVGTIVKINNPVSGKTIFAKVLGNLPDMKESMGLIARLSDAGATQIDATGVKFSVEVRY